MAIKSIGKIVLYESLNQAKISELLSSADTVVLEIERLYPLDDTPELLSAVLPLQFDDVSIDYIDAFKKVVDASLYIHEKNVCVFKINFNEIDKSFDLSESYVRNLRDTSLTMSGIVTDQNLSATFITPGLDASKYTTINLPYDNDISSIDLAKLLDVGIELELDSTGTLFAIKTQTVPFKVYFSRPSGVVEKYCIDFNYKNKTIEI